MPFARQRYELFLNQQNMQASFQKNMYFYICDFVSPTEKSAKS